jgi:hypothetical protein
VWAKEFPENVTEQAMLKRKKQKKISVTLNINLERKLSKENHLEVKMYK